MTGLLDPISMQNQNKNNSFKCTLCICTYQMGDSISKTIESLLCNTNESIEILIVDDGSNDETFAICKNFSENFSRVNYIFLERDPKRKLGETRNISVAAAKSEVVVLHIDADDCWGKGIQEIINFYLYFRFSLNIRKMIIGNHLALTSKDIFWAANGYENIYRGEDRDFMFRLVKNQDVFFLDHEIIYTRQKRKLKRTFYKSFKDIWSHSKYDAINSHDLINLVLSSLFLSPKNKSFSLKVKFLRFIFIPICLLIFFSKRKKPIITWEKFMRYRSHNRGDAIQLIQKANLKNFIHEERDKTYEESLSNYPFTVKIRPEGFSI